MQSCLFNAGIATIVIFVTFLLLCQIPMLKCMNMCHCRYWSNDDRWEAAKPEQRTSMFQARFGALAAAAAERRASRRKQLEADYKLLLQQLGLTADSSWRSDVRDAVRSAITTYQQQQQQQQQRKASSIVNGAAAAAEHKAAEHKAEEDDEGEIEGAVAVAAGDDGSGGSSSNGGSQLPPGVTAAAVAAAAELEEADREALFRGFVSELYKQREKQTAAEREQQQRQQAAAARMAEQQAESEARQRRAARYDATAAFNTLLSEMVREPGGDFETFLPKLKKDPLVSCLYPADGGLVRVLLSCC
jgi:hypothetical protein